MDEANEEGRYGNNQDPARGSNTLGGRTSGSNHLQENLLSADRRSHSSASRRSRISDDLSKSVSMRK